MALLKMSLLSYLSVREIFEFFFSLINFPRQHNVKGTGGGDIRRRSLGENRFEATVMQSVR
jgi:hypothetical protein